jgi:hypothetical protein
LDIKAAVDRALLRALNITNDGTDVTVSFFGVAGRKYRLERKIDINLTNPDWQPIPNVLDYTALTTGPAPIVDPGVGNQPHLFYRVELLP